MASSFLLNSCSDEPEASAHSYTEQKAYEDVKKNCKDDEEHRFLRAGYEGDESLLAVTDSSVKMLHAYMSGAAIGAQLPCW